MSKQKGQTNCPCKKIAIGSTKHNCIPGSTQSNK
jgi:hypothetical protein